MGCVSNTPPQSIRCMSYILLKILRDDFCCKMRFLSIFINVFVHFPLLWLILKACEHFVLKVTKRFCHQTRILFLLIDNLDDEFSISQRITLKLLPTPQPSQWLAPPTFSQQMHILSFLKLFLPTAWPRRKISQHVTTWLCWPKFWRA